MKINKFKVISYIVFGLGAFSATVEASKFGGVNLNPNVVVANQVAPAVKEGIIQGGNYLWNREVKQQNKDFYNVEFETREDDFEEVNYITQTQEAEKLEKILNDRLNELDNE